MTDEEFGVHPQLRNVNVQRSYLELLGHLVWRVSGMEHLVLDDLNHHRPPLPGFDYASLTSDSTKGIGNRLKQLATTWDAYPEAKAFTALAGEALVEVGQLRNDVLHARAATVDGRHRLVRNDLRGTKQRHFVITPEHLVDVCSQVDHWHERLFRIRCITP